MPRGSSPIALTDEQRDLVATHIGLAYFEAHSMHVGKLSFDERLAACMYALCLAARTWDPAKSTLSTYHRHWCLSILRKDAKSQREIIHTPVYAAPAHYSDLEVEPATPIVLDDDPETIEVLSRDLTRRQRETIRALYADGENPHDLAATWGVTTQAVSHAHRRALERMRPLAWEVIA